MHTKNTTSNGLTHVCKTCIESSILPVFSESKTSRRGNRLLNDLFGKLDVFQVHCSPLMEGLPMVRQFVLKTRTHLKGWGIVTSTLRETGQRSGQSTPTVNRLCEVSSTSCPTCNEFECEALSS